MALLQGLPYHRLINFARLVTILTGAGMATVSIFVSCVVLFLSPLSRFPEVSEACDKAGVPGQICADNAYAAGLWGTAGFFLITLSLFIVWWLRISKTPASASISPLLTQIIVVGGLLFVATHLVAMEWAPAYGSRIAELARFSVFISIENLMWPLLVQLLLLEQDSRIRISIRGLLLFIVALSPYRSVALAIFIFAFALPLLFVSIGNIGAGLGRRQSMAIARNLAGVLLAGLAIFWFVGMDTEARAISASPVGAAHHRKIELSAGARLQQRLAYPLYQAAIISHLAATRELPSVFDEIARKFHLSDKPNLNEYAYNVIYPSHSSFTGQTTSLYFGEGAAYFGNGIIWTLVAPFLFLIGWLAFSRLGLEVSGVLGIAVWRSSFAGLIAVAPGVILQLAAMTCLAFLSRTLRAENATVRRATTAAAWLLTVVALALAALQAASLHESVRRSSVIQITFAPPATCRFAVDRTGDIQRAIDRQAAMSGLNLKSVVTAVAYDSLTVVLPYGTALENQSGGLLGAFSSFVECDRTPEPGTVASLRSSKKVSGTGPIPLRILTAGYLLLGGFLFLYGRNREKRPEAEENAGRVR